MAYRDARLNELIGMLSAMASLDFSQRLQVGSTEDPIEVVAYGLNMLSEELQVNTVKRTMLEDVNGKLAQFAYTVAHDIKSPINASLGLIDIIESETAESANETVKECLRLLKQTNARLNDMVNGILAYSKAENSINEQEEIDIVALCRQVIGLQQVHRRVRLEVNGKIPAIVYNKVAMEQIFGNLIDNAVKHNDKEECVLELNCRQMDNCIEIALKDNGPGIKAEDQEKVFELFENLHSGREDSYGIGLSIVKKLVSQGGGNIRLVSEPGLGSRFIFTVCREPRLSVVGDEMYN